MTTARYVRKREKIKPTLIPNPIIESTPVVEPTIISEKFLTDMDDLPETKTVQEKLLIELETDFDTLASQIRDNLLGTQDAYANVGQIMNGDMRDFLHEQVALKTHQNILPLVTQLNQLSQKIPPTETTLKNAVEKYQNYVVDFISDAPKKTPSPTLAR